MVFPDLLIDAPRAARALVVRAEDPRRFRGAVDVIQTICVVGGKVCARLFQAAVIALIPQVGEAVDHLSLSVRRVAVIVDRGRTGRRVRRRLEALRVAPVLLAHRQRLCAVDRLCEAEDIGVLAEALGLVQLDLVLRADVLQQLPEHRAALHRGQLVLVAHDEQPRAVGDRLEQRREQADVDHGRLVDDEDRLRGELVLLIPLEAVAGKVIAQKPVDGVLLQLADRFQNPLAAFRPERVRYEAGAAQNTLLHSRRRLAGRRCKIDRSVRVGAQEGEQEEEDGRGLARAGAAGHEQIVVAALFDDLLLPRRQGEVRANRRFEVDPARLRRIGDEQPRHGRRDAALRVIILPREQPAAVDEEQLVLPDDGQRFEIAEGVHRRKQLVTRRVELRVRFGGLFFVVLRVLTARVPELAVELLLRKRPIERQIEIAVVDEREIQLQQGKLSVLLRADLRRDQLYQMLPIAGDQPARLHRLIKIPVIHFSLPSL